MQKYSVKYSQSELKMIIHHDYIDFIAEIAGMVQYMKITKCIYHRNKLREKPHNHLIRYGKGLLTIPIPFHDKRLGKIRDTKDIPNCNKGNFQLAFSQHHIKWRETLLNIILLSLSVTDLS
jgi:hypothetical protein